MSGTMDLSQYKERVEGIVASSTTALMMGLGQKVGLFKAMCDIGRPCTSCELAKMAHLKERYVREWLGCMVANEIVYMNDEDKYYLPAEAGWTLSQGYMASLIPMFGAKSPEIIKIMDENGPNGFTYDDNTDFMEWLDQDRQAIGDGWIEENIRPVTNLIKRDNLTILDFGCGTGRIAIALSKYYKKASVYGIDETEKFIIQANSYAAEQNCKEITFLATEGEKLPTDWSEKFDLVIAVDVIHDLANPQQSVDEIRRILKPEGYMIAFDPAVHSDHRKNVNVPRAGALYTFSMFSCLPCSMSRPPYVGNGVGWGYEKRKQFLEDCKFKIVPIGDEDVEEIKFRLTCQKLE